MMVALHMGLFVASLQLFSFAFPFVMCSSQVFGPPPLSTLVGHRGPRPRIGFFCFVVLVTEGFSLVRDKTPFSHRLLGKSEFSS